MPDFVYSRTASSRKRRKVFIGFFFIVSALLLLAATVHHVVAQEPESAVPITVDNESPNSAVPITVDGTSTGGEYDTSAALGFASGSIYRSLLGDSTSQFIAFVRPLQNERGLYLVANITSSLINGNDAYAPGAVIARIVSPAALIEVRRAVRSRSGLYEYFADIDQDGQFDGSPSRFGIAVAAGGGASGTPFTVEMAIPLDGPKAVFLPGRLLAEFFAPAGQSFTVADAGVTIGGENLTRSDAAYVPERAVIDVGNIVDLSKQGLIPVTIASSPAFNAMSVDPGTVILRDHVGTLSPTPANLLVAYNGGTLVLGPYYSQPGARVVKSNSRTGGNGKVDLVLWFRTEDLVALGAVDLNTTKVVLIGKTFGGRPVTGTAPVRIGR